MKAIPITGCYIRCIALKIFVHFHLAEKVSESKWKTFMMNVTRWRDEPAALPPLAARLVRWMEAAQPNSQAASDEIAAGLALAWQELLDARGVALWAVAESGKLELLGRAGEFEGAVDTDTRIEFGKGAWPQHSFFLVEGNGAARDLAATLGLMSESVATPSLCVTLGENAIALLWLESSDGCLGEEWQPIIESLSAHSGALIDGALRAERMGRSLFQLSQAVAAAIDGREAHREGYSAAVAFYAGLIGREMKLNEADLERIEFAAQWHGLGRLSIPDAILQKEAPLSSDELGKVRGAAQWGADKLASVEGLEKIADIVRHQNEHYDGSGAPDGLSGHAIPVGSRVLAVAARFAAMTNPRADRAPMSVVGGAMDGVAEKAGTVLDPNVVEAFLAAMGRGIN